MALDKTNLDITGSGSKGVGVIATYDSGSDNKAAVKADGYFDSVADELARVSAILIIASDATFLAKVSISGTDVTLAALDTYA